MPLFRKERQKAAILFALVFFHLLVISFQVPRGTEQSYFERAIFSLFSPVQRAVHSVLRGVQNIWRNYFYLRDVQEQNQRMREELFFLRQENNFLKNTLRTFKSEKEIQEALTHAYGSLLVSSVIGVDAGNSYKSVIIDKGSLDGIRKDMAVLDRHGHLTGRVIGPVASRESRVQLITDEDCRVGVYSDKKGVNGILAGDADGFCLMKYILSTNKDVVSGEEVLTSGFDSIFPAGIKVGRIISITDSSLPFKKIVVKPYFDFADLSQVAVLTIPRRDFQEEEGQ